MSAVLELAGLCAGYGARAVLNDVDLTLAAGELITVAGVNGAGKSTLLRTIMGTTAALDGELFFRGSSISAWPVHRRVQAGIGFSPEGRRVFANMTVEQNLLAGAATLRRRRERAGLDRVLDLFGELSGRLAQRAGTLSGGEQQMLAIGRAMMSRPRLLMVEEPSQGLAPVVVDRVYHGLRCLAGDGVAVLVAEQFQQVREESSHRVLVIYTGRLIETGAGADQRAAP